MWDSIYAPDGNSARKTGSKKETTWGNQSFRKLIQFLYFWVCLYTFCYTYRDEYSHTGVSSPDLYQNQVLHINVLKKVLGILHHLLAMSETC